MVLKDNTNYPTGKSNLAWPGAHRLAAQGQNGETCFAFKIQKSQIIKFIEIMSELEKI